MREFVFELKHFRPNTDVVWLSALAKRSQMLSIPVTNRYFSHALVIPSEHGAKKCLLAGFVRTDTHFVCEVWQHECEDFIWAS